MRSRAILVFALCALCARSAFAQEAPAETAESILRPAVANGPSFRLEDALRLLLAGHPLLSAARASSAAAAADVVTAGLWTNPQVSATYTRSVGFTTYHPALGMPQLQLSQFLETSNAPGARRHVAEYQRDAANIDVQALERALSFEVRDAVVVLTEAQVRLSVLQGFEADMQHATQVVQARFDAGATPHYDLRRVSIALADAHALVGDAEADVVAARGALSVAVGPLSSQLQGPVVFDLLQSEPLPSLAELLSIAADRPDVAAARTRALAAGAQVEVARRSVLPGFTIYGGTTFGAGVGNNGNELQADLTIGASVALPVVDRGQGAIPAAEQRAVAAQSYAGALEVQTRQRLTATYNEVQRRREVLTAFLNTGVFEARGMRREAEAGYREGRLSILELVDAYTSQRDARLRLVQLAFEARRAGVALARAVGAAR